MHKVYLKVIKKKKDKKLGATIWARVQSMTLVGLGPFASILAGFDMHRVRTEGNFIFVVQCVCIIVLALVYVWV